MSKIVKVNFNGMEYTLKQDAYIAGTNESPHYEAHAIDADSNEVMVEWSIKEHWLNEDGTLNSELEDESDACEWEAPVNVYSI